MKSVLRAGDFLDDQQILRGEGAPVAPEVSVILPTYRRGESGLLARAIKSVLAQTFRDLELLVMDDGSDDGSAEVIGRLRQDDPRIVHVRHEINCGLPALRVNEGIELARGRYLAFQFDDDVWRPEALETLRSAAERQDEPAVLVGHSHFSAPHRERTMPSVALNRVTLVEQNRFANNSVLFPRMLVESLGMYDCHIGMRRLCDWDLWLRYIRYVPFVVVPTIVSDVFESSPGSIGLTVPWDLPLFRHLHDIPRDHLLTPCRWREYPIDALRIDGTEVAKDHRRRLYEDHIVPHYLRLRHCFPRLEGFSANVPAPRRTVLYSSRSHAGHVSGLGVYEATCTERGTYKGHVQLVDQMTPGWSRDVDGLLLFGAPGQPEVRLVDEALAEGVPVAVYADGVAWPPAEELDRVDALWTPGGAAPSRIPSVNPRTLVHPQAVPADRLPSGLGPRDAERSRRIGVLASRDNSSGLEAIWEALRQVSMTHAERLIFEIWGPRPDGLAPLSSPLRHRPPAPSHAAHLDALSRSGLDLLIAPPNHPWPLGAYCDSAVAEALAVLPDVPQLASVPAGQTCFKAGGDPESWRRAIEEALALSPPRFDEMRARALAHVREEFTDRAQVHGHEAAWRATEFHARTRSRRHADGRPRILYVWPPPELGDGASRWAGFRWVRDYGIEPVVAMPARSRGHSAVKRWRESLRAEGVPVVFADYACFAQPRSPAEVCGALELGAVKNLLERFRPSLVHSFAFIPALGPLCADLGIPHLASLYAIDEDLEWPAGGPGFVHARVVQSDTLRYAKRWAHLLNAETLCIREAVAAELFGLGRSRLQALEPGKTTRPFRLAVLEGIQEENGILELIETMAALRGEGLDCHLHVFGRTDTDPDYFRRCRERVMALGISERVFFRGAGTGTVAALASADAVFCGTRADSLPILVKEAMAAAVVVIATPRGGTPEIVIDGVTGFFCQGHSVAAVTAAVRQAIGAGPHGRVRMRERAYRVARSEFSPDRAANDWLDAYNRALVLSARVGGERRPAASTPAAINAFGRVVYPAQPASSHVRLKRSLRYRLSPERSHWSGVDVFVGTHERPASGRMVLEVHSESGRRLRKTSVDLSAARDNDWLRFHFAPIAHAAGRSFRVTFRLHPGFRTAISLYEVSPPEPRFRRALRRAGMLRWGNVLYCRNWYESRE